MCWHRLRPSPNDQFTQQNGQRNVNRMPVKLSMRKFVIIAMYVVPCQTLDKLNLGLLMIQGWC